MSLLFGYVVAVAVGLSVHFEMHIVFNKFAERKSIYEERQATPVRKRCTHVQQSHTHTFTIAGSLSSSFHFRLSLSTGKVHGPVRSHVIPGVAPQNTRCRSLCRQYRCLWHVQSAQLRAHTTPCHPLSDWASMAVIYHKYFPNDT